MIFSNSSSSVFVVGKPSLSVLWKAKETGVKFCLGLFLIMPKKKNFSRLIPNVFVPFFLSFDFCCYEITTEVIYIKLYYLQK